MSVNPTNARALLALGPVIPVIVIDDVATAPRLARALVEGGIRVLEVTLRTPVALQAIQAMREAVPEAIVGAGTVLGARQLDDALAAGSQFIVSPGWSASVSHRARDRGVPLLPGAVTATEIMAALEDGVDTLKFFPAARCGGVALLKDFAAVFSQVRFCPTGGIDLASAPNYLALPNVGCVGMSSVAPLDLLRKGDYAAITAQARLAAALPRA